MKKLLAFVLLFGAALLVLRYFEDESQPGTEGGGTPERTDAGDAAPGVAGPGEQGPPAASTAGEEPGSTGAEAPEAGTQAGERQPGLSIQGPFEARLYRAADDDGRRSLALVVAGDDSRTERIPAGEAKVEGAGDLRDVLLDAEARVYDEESAETPQVRLDARSILFPRAAQPTDPAGEVSTAGGLEPAWVRVATLDTVEVTLLSGAPFVPLAFEAPTAELDARAEGARVLHAPGPIVLDSEELDASGQDLTIALDRGEFEFAREGRVTFTRPPADVLTLVSTGPLVVRQRKDLAEEDVVEIEARDGALLTLSGENTSTLRARTIRARGRERAGAEGEFELEWFEADGDVVWTAGETAASGQRARLSFEDGELSSWTLSGDPSLRILVEDLQGVELAGVPSRGFVRVTGVGPLTGTSGDVRSFRMAGPALIEGIDAAGDGLPHTTLRAAGSVRGSLRTREEDPDAVASSELQADGGVLLEAPEGTLEAQALTVALERDENDEDVYRVTTIGGARLDGRTTGEDEDDVLLLTLITTGRLRATRSGGTWRVHEAEDATLLSEPADLDERPEAIEDVLRAQAGSVTYFDPRSGDLRAEGGVVVQGADGVGRGRSIEVSGGERYELFGSLEQPASFEGAEGRASALYLRREGTRTLARGQVLTRFVRAGGPDLPDQDYEIRADVLDTDQVREPAEEGEVRTFHLEARGLAGAEERAALLATLVEVGVVSEEAADDVPLFGRVDGRVGFGEESSTILCATLVGDRVERWRVDALGEATPFDASTTLSATGAIEGTLSLEGSQVDLACEALDLTRAESLVPRQTDAEADPELTPFRLLVDARGKVEFDVVTTQAAEPVHLSGRGERLQFDETLTGELLPAQGERVRLDGSLPGQETPYSLDAARIEFRGQERLEAVDPNITISSEGEVKAGELGRFRVRAARLVATQEALVLDGDVRLDSRTSADAPWAVTTEHLELRGGVGGSGPRLERMSADGGVSVMLGLRGRALGDGVVARADAHRITGSTAVGAIRLEGFPDGRRTTVVTPALLTEADWIEVDPELQLIRRSGPGRMLPATEAEPGIPDWELRYSAAQSFEQHERDAYVFAIDQPYFESLFMDGLLRGSLALFWFDRVGWQDLPARVEEARDPEEILRREALRQPDRSFAPALPLARLTEVLRSRNLDGVLKEVYFEGPIEVLRGDQLVAHAESIYVDTVENSAKMVDAQLNIFGKDVDEDFEKLVIRADLVRQTPHGVLLADRAQVTTSPFAVPNLVVETGDLRIAPAPGEGDKKYQVYLRENRIHFRSPDFSLPLPSMAFGLDEELKPIWPTARLGNSARFGTLLTLGFRRPLPKGLGDTVHDALGGDEEDPYDASFSADVSYLSGRGALFDLGVDIEAADDYELELLFGVVPDSGGDEGYIQVPEDDRSSPRLWFRAHSRFALDTAEWLDVEATFQSDAGVQSEFWEDEFERYEQDETYVQWRKADGETYYQASVKPQLDSFRSTVEELPSAGAHFGRRPVLDLGFTRIVWDGDLTAAFLRRSAGESGVQSPFAETPPLDGSDAFADGFGDRDVLRVDTRQRLETPLRLGGLVATPFTDARFTGWDEGTNPEASPTRFVAEAGLRLATQLWRRNSNGTFHQLVPFVEYANALVEERTGTPVPFDRTEDPVGGDRLDLGLRGRLGVSEGQSRLDFEVRARHQRDVPAGVRPGWQPLSIFARLGAQALGAPVQIWHDARYDLEEGTTPYALTAVGVQASDALGFEIGHRTGRDPADQRLFEAAVLSALYRWTEKWEFEGRQVYSLLNDNGLDAGLILRRYGTDLVFEIEFEVREGEGTSIGIGFRPRFGYSPSSIGTIGF